MWTLALGLALAAPRPVLSLEEAVSRARTDLPEVQGARAASRGAHQEVGVRRSGLLPSIAGSLAYRRTTSNFTGLPGSVPGSLAGTLAERETSRSVDYFAAQLGVDQTLFDFGASWHQFAQARAQARQAEDAEREVLARAVLTARQAFFRAQSARGALRVRQQSLDNQQHTRRQIEAFVQVGTRPEVDLAKARLDVSNAEGALLQAGSDYETALAAVARAVGGGLQGPFEVADEDLPPLSYEGDPEAALVARALDGRGAVGALAAAARAQQSQVAATRAGFLPVFAGHGSFTDAGQQLDTLRSNWSLGVTMSWPLFAGGSSYYGLGSARWALTQATRAHQTKVQDVRLAVQKARLALASAQAQHAVAREAESHAEVLLRLASGRYQAGLGNVIELGTAQLDRTTAAQQQVAKQAEVATARAQLAYEVGDAG